MEKIKNKISKLNIRFGVQVSLGSILAMFFAQLLGLKYGVTAGITTLLTVQNTKRETLEVSLKRFLGFILMVITTYLLFNSLGYNIYVFGLFILFYVLLCNGFDIQVGIVSNAVLASHFLLEQSTSWNMIVNEFFILLIGASMGIIINLLTPIRTFNVKENQDMVDYKTKETLELIGLRLKGQFMTGKEGKDPQLNELFIDRKIRELDLDLDRLNRDLVEASNNMVNSDEAYFHHYLQMRYSQINIIKLIWTNVKKLDMDISQRDHLADLVIEVSQGFVESEEVEIILRRAEEALSYFRKDDLPKTRDEFEERALMYVILNDIIGFLELKRKFVNTLTREDKKVYWNCDKIDGVIYCERKEEYKR